MILDWTSLLEWWWLLPLFGFVWAPKTWTPGELVTAASMNTNIRDHLNEGLKTQTTTLTGTQNNFALDGPFVYLKCNNASVLTLTGILIDGGNVDGSRVIVEALNSTVTLKHQDAGSTTSNRFINDQGTDISLAQLERALLIYDTANTRWRVGKISTGPIAETIGATNLFPDPYFLIWPAGDAAAPAGATLTQDGNSALARNTTIPFIGGMSPELKLGTTATISSKLTYTIFSSLPSELKGKFVSLGAALRSATASLGQLEIDDGGAAGAVKSAFHDGGDAWDWITFSHKLAADATKLDVSLVADIGGQGGSEVTALFDALTLILGPSPPTFFIPTPSAEGVLYFPVPGTVSTATDKFRFLAGRPFLVRNVTLRAKTAPTGSALIVDVNHWDGSTFQSMFTTRPQLAAAAKNGGANPDGTYRYRCFNSQKDAESETDDLLSADIDQVGSTVAGADLEILVRVLQFQDPLAALKSF